MRRTLIIVAAAIVLIGLLIGAYFLFFSGTRSGVTVTENPFGDTAGDRPITDNTSSGPINGAGTIVAPRLMHITEGPVARGVVGITIRSTEVASGTPELGDTEVRYIERASGNVFSFRVHDRVLTRIGNRTLPGVLEAAWSPDGSRAFARFLTTQDGVDRAATYALPADGSEGYFLEAGLASVGITGSSSVYTLLPSASGSVASVATLSGSSVRTLFTSTLASITLASAGKDFVATTKPAESIGGYAFLVNGTTGAFSRILGPLGGLTTLADPTGKLVLYSYTNRGKLYTAVFDTVTRTAVALPVATLTEKCAWVPGVRAVYCGVPAGQKGTLPDEWLQGALSFEDRLWRIDMDTRLATLVIDPSQLAETPVDMVALTLDPLADVLFFVNRIDGSLWSYDF